MFKNVIAPVQAWLLSQSRCVGCGVPLAQGKTENNKITCKCGRIFIKDDNSKYRRALFEEV